MSKPKCNNPEHELMGYGKEANKCRLCNPEKFCYHFTRTSECTLCKLKKGCKEHNVENNICKVCHPKDFVADALHIAFEYMVNNDVYDDDFFPYLDCTYLMFTFHIESLFGNVNWDNKKYWRLKTKFYLNKMKEESYDDIIMNIDYKQFTIEKYIEGAIPPDGKVSKPRKSKFTELIDKPIFNDNELYKICGGALCKGKNVNLVNFDVCGDREQVNCKRCNQYNVLFKRETKRKLKN